MVTFYISMQNIMDVNREISFYERKKNSPMKKKIVKRWASEKMNTKTIIPIHQLDR